MSQDDRDGTNIKALTSAVGRQQMAVPKFEKPQPVTQPPIKVAELCRWSGCYRECPDGLQDGRAQRRQGIMATDENCLSGGLDKLCCPGDEDMPVCTWRGHKNSGACSPGCKGGEVDVGTLGVGCSSKHQTACCTNVPATAAYGECKWVGTASSCNPDCHGDFPTKMVSTKRGAGGEQPCIIGQKSYCCRDPKPAAFATCDWYKKEAPAKFEQDFICEDACPTGQIKLATEAGGLDRTGGCFGGARAFCCEPAKPKVVPREEDDPFGGKQNKEFHLLLEKYMDNPTCPATLLHPSPGSIFQGTVDKRALALAPALDLETEASEVRVLQGRARDCDLDRFTRMVQYAALMLTMADSMLEPLSWVYNELLANSYDAVLRAADLRSHYYRFSHLDPKNFISYLFLKPTEAGHIVRRQAQTGQIFCEPGSRRLARREAGDVAQRPRLDVIGFLAGCSGAPLSSFPDIKLT